MNQFEYKTAFTIGGLFYRESMDLANLFLEVGDWSSVRTKALETNLLRARTKASLSRVITEVVSRLKELTQNELRSLTEMNEREQLYLLWVATCRRYRLLADFATEVLRERYITIKPDVTHTDFDIFFNRKSEWHKELDRLSRPRRDKVRQVVFKILREGGLLTRDYKIIPPLMSSSLINLISEHDPNDALLFPLFESDIAATRDN
jgi:hypothetical protein